MVEAAGWRRWRLEQAGRASVSGTRAEVNRPGWAASAESREDGGAEP